MKSPTTAWKPLPIPCRVSYPLKPSQGHFLFSRGSNAATNLPAAGDPSLMILRERFARGELTTEEFEQARRTLEDR